MRMAAGILMIIVSFMSFAVPQQLAEELAFRIADSAETYASLVIESSGWIVFSSLVSLGLIAGGGICALIKKAWWWALSGAIGCAIIGLIHAMLSLLTTPPTYHNVAGAVGAATLGIICILVGILAVIFLIMRRGEFQ